MLGRAAGTALSAALLLAGCCYTPVAVKPGPRPGPAGEPRVRVRLLAASNPVRISSTQELAVSFAGQRLRVGAGEQVELTAGRDIKVGALGREWRGVTDTVFLRAVSGAFTRAGERRYRGDVLAFRSGEGELVVVNELGLEEYLCGVVPCEIGPITPETFEAVKAQAVAARSFTLTRLGKRKGLGFQLYDSYARDQEYRGVERETELGSKAVTETAGEVLLYDGEPAEALYHANCGGITATGSQPYLKPVRDGPAGKPFCAWGKYHQWRAELSPAQYETTLARLAGVGGRVKLRGVMPEKDKESGRVRKLGLDTDRGRFQVNGSDFRMALGLRSTLFDLKLSAGRIVFTGKGWGHGCGLCQHGAVEMARRGRNYREILLHYYSGVRLGRRY